ncbi:hypothetical protein ACFX2I_044504 [Malus domestica]
MARTTGYLSKSRSRRIFRILIGRGHLISLLGEVRCYQVTVFGTLKAECDIELRKLAALSSGSKTQEAENCSFLGRNRKTQKSAARSTQHQQILLLGQARPTSWHAPHTTEGRS